MESADEAGLKKYVKDFVNMEAISTMFVRQKTKRLSKKKRGSESEDDEPPLP